MTPEELKQAVEEFNQIYKEEFGSSLDAIDATSIATNLLQLFVCLAEG